MLTHSQSTIGDRRRVLRSLHESLPFGVAYATTEQIRAWLTRPNQWTGEDRAPNSINIETRHVLEFYRDMTRRGFLDGDPTAEIKPPDPTRGRPREQRAEHIAVLMSAPWPIPTITLAGLREGLRRAEIAGLFREDITKANTHIRRGKGGHPGDVPTHPQWWAHVQALPVGPACLVGGVELHPLIWDARTGLPLDPQQLSRIWRKARATLGLPDDVVPHRDRHSFGQAVRRLTRDLTITARSLRHRSLGYVQTYADADDEEVSDAVTSLPPVPSPRQGETGELPSGSEAGSNSLGAASDSPPES